MLLVKRPRGRPRKVPKVQPFQQEMGSSLKIANVETYALAQHISLSQQTSRSSLADEMLPVKRKRGRPRKKRRVASDPQAEVHPTDYAEECQVEEGNNDVLAESLCSSLRENSQGNGGKMITGKLHGQVPDMQTENLHQESDESLTDSSLLVREGESKLANSQQLKNLCIVTGGSEQHETDGCAPVILQTHTCNGVPQLIADGSQQPTMMCDELVDWEPPVLQKMSDEVDTREQLPDQSTTTGRKEVRFPAHSSDVLVGHAGPTNMDLFEDKPMIDIAASMHDGKEAIPFGQSPCESHTDASKHAQNVLPRKTIVKSGKRPIGRPRKHARKHPILQPTKQREHEMKDNELLDAKQGLAALPNKVQNVLPKEIITKPGKRPVGRPRKHPLQHPILQPTKQVENEKAENKLSDAKQEGPGLPKDVQNVLPRKNIIKPGKRPVGRPKKHQLKHPIVQPNKQIENEMADNKLRDAEQESLGLPNDDQNVLPRKNIMKPGKRPVGRPRKHPLNYPISQPVKQIKNEVADNQFFDANQGDPGLPNNVQNVLPRKNDMKPGKRPVGRPRKHALKHPTLQPAKRIKNQLTVYELLDEKQGGPGLPTKHKNAQGANFKAMQESEQSTLEQVFGHNTSSRAAYNGTQIEAASLDLGKCGEHEDLKASWILEDGISNTDTSTVVAAEVVSNPLSFSANRRRGRPRKHFHNVMCLYGRKVKTPFSPLIRPKRNVKSRYARPHSNQTEFGDAKVHKGRKRGRPRKSIVRQDTGCPGDKEPGMNDKVKTSPSASCKNFELTKHLSYPSENGSPSLSAAAQRQNDFVKGSQSPRSLHSTVAHAQQPTCQVYPGYNHCSLSPQRVIPAVCYSERNPQFTGNGVIIPSFQQPPNNAYQDMCNEPFPLHLQGTDKCSKDCKDHITHDEGSRRVPTICLQKIPKDMMTGTLTLDANDTPTGYSAGIGTSPGKHEQFQKFYCKEHKSQVLPTSMVQSHRSSGGSIVRLNTSKPCQYLSGISTLSTNDMICDNSKYQPEKRVICLNIGQSNECQAFEHASAISQIPSKKKRGRPRKNLTVSSNTSGPKLIGTMVKVTSQKNLHHKGCELLGPTAVKVKKRGRPRKSTGFSNMSGRNATNATGGALVLPNFPQSSMRRSAKVSKSSIKIAKSTDEVDVQSNHLAFHAGKRKVGRPRKCLEVVKLPVMPIKRRRGRPCKREASSFHEVRNNTGTEPKTSHAAENEVQGASVGKPCNTSKFSTYTAVPKRKVGRPRIHPEVKVAKKRGRPRKNREPEKMCTPKKRGRPRLKPESGVCKKRGRPCLHVEPKVAKKRGRPCLNPNSQMPKKRGRPRKHPVPMEDPPKYPLVPLPITDKLIFGPFAFQSQEMLHCNFASSQASTLFHSSSNAVSASETGANEAPTEDLSHGENAVDVTSSCIMESICAEGEVCPQDQPGQKSLPASNAEMSWTCGTPIHETDVVSDAIPSPTKSDDPVTTHQFISNVHLECSSPELPNHVQEPHGVEGCTTPQLQATHVSDLPETATTLESVATMDSAMFLTCLRLNDKSSSIT
ncbi:uncharacterized protein [Diadema setosum]|uniref:uncharacterized protein n=1 Tax=Diadema setosum TaxID=31175 RepID=UPI003B3A1CEE